jgi:2-methylcitrate dehydratase PrpD
MRPLAEQLGDYVASFPFESIPENVVEHAKLCLLDALGVAATSFDKPWCNAVLEVVRKQGGLSEASVWYHTDRVPDTNAALTNAMFVHSMDFNDDLAGIQVGGIVPPTALAVAESSKASGKELIAAIVIGYDVAARAAVAMDPQDLYLRGLQPTAMCGAYAAAAVAGRLLRLTPAQLASAFGIAASYSGGTLEFLKEGTDTKRFHVAKAAHGGILSAHLAKAGLVGPRTVFEGEFGALRAYSDRSTPERLVEALGIQFDILDTSVKRFPCCDGNAAPLEAALTIVTENGLSVEDIESIHFRVKSFLIPYLVDYHGDKERKYRPQTELDAQMSLPYCLGVTVLNNGRLRIEDFQPQRFSDPHVLALGDRVTAEGDPELDKIPLKPMSMPAIATLKTRDGRTFVKRVDYQKGDPRNPFSIEDFRNKFVECTSAVLAADSQQKVIDEVLSLDRAGDVGRLVQTLNKHLERQPIAV